MSASSGEVPKKWSGGWLTSASFQLEMVVDLHLAAPKRILHILAHVYVSILAKSRLRDVASTGLSLPIVTKDLRMT